MAATAPVPRLFVIRSRSGTACRSLQSARLALAAGVSLAPTRSYATTKRASAIGAQPPASLSNSTPVSPNEVTSPSAPLRQHDEHGRIVLYRGPCTLKRGWFYFLGGTFLAIGFEAGYDIYNYFTWPFVGDEKRLVAQWKRTIGAGCAIAVGIAASSLVLCIPSRTVTRLSLDVGRRELVIRTAIRGFSALPPRILYPRAIRRNAERYGWYLTEHNNERVVPLANVFRLRGSALNQSSTASSGAATGKVRVIPAHKIKQRASHDPHRRTIELRVGGERLWYNVEAAGGAPPGTMGQKSGFSARLAYWVRGSTDWSGVARPPIMPAIWREGMTNKEGVALQGEKQPWFADRGTFDDIFPLVRRS